MGKALIAALALATAGAPATRDVIPVYVSANASFGTDFEYVISGSPQRLELGVFRRRPLIQDVLPVELQQLVRFMSASPLHPEPARSRLLVARGVARVYAFPTKEGGVCYFLEPRGGGSCTSALMHGAFPVVDPRRDVWGLLDDNARQVDVRLAHSTLRAAVGRNGFYLRLPRGVVVPRDLVVTDRDGSRHVYVIERCSPEKLATELPSGPLGPPPGC